MLAPTPLNGSKKRITFAEHDTTYSADSTSGGDDNSSVQRDSVSTQSSSVPTRMLYPHHRHPNIKMEKMNKLKHLSASLDNWGFEGDLKGTKVYSRTLEDNKLVLRADSIILDGWTAEQVCSVVQNFGARKMCKCMHASDAQSSLYSVFLNISLSFSLR